MDGEDRNGLSSSEVNCLEKLTQNSPGKIPFDIFFAILQGRVVQKLVDANLDVNQGFCFSCYKAFALLIFGYSLKAVKVEF